MLAWVDVETTGLDPDEGDLLEVGFILTDDELRELGRTSAVVRPRPGPLAREIERFHGTGGLLDEARSWSSLPPELVESSLVGWLERRGADGGVTPLAGNTVGFDRAWLRAKMPRLEALFHYRSVDVSSLKELNERWGFAPKWEGDRKLHRALPDLEDSIAELRHYRTGFVVRLESDDPWVTDEWGGPQ